MGNLQFPIGTTPENIPLRMVPSCKPTLVGRAAARAHPSLAGCSFFDFHTFSRLVRLAPKVMSSCKINCFESTKGTENAWGHWDR